MKKSNSLGDEFGTPRPLYEHLNREFNFTLDAAASEKNHKHARYYTKKDDSLKQPWFLKPIKGSQAVFCNPPYSRRTKTNPGIEAWCMKAFSECVRAVPYLEKNVENFYVVMLIPGDFSTGYFRYCYRHAKQIRLIGCRFNFEGGESSARFPGMLVVFDALHTTKQSSRHRAEVVLWNEWRPETAKRL